MPWASQVALAVKNSVFQCRRHKRLRFNPWVRKIPWRTAWQPSPAFLPGEFHRQRIVHRVTKSQTQQRLVCHVVSTMSSDDPRGNSKDDMAFQSCSTLGQVHMLSHFSHARLFAAPWTVAHQAPLSMGFSRQDYWSGLPCPPPRDLPE